MKAQYEWRDASRGWGLGLRVEDLGFRVGSSGFRVWSGLAIRPHGPHVLSPLGSGNML